MTRVIKFRAWDGYSMLKDVQTWTDDFTDMLNETFKMWANPELSQHLELMQFTGLLDKNGKEIYEGDIVKSRYNYQVIFEHGAFYLYHLEHKNWDGKNLQWGLLNRMYDSDMKDLFKDFEVIGNIYENKDLLNDA